MSSVLFRGYFFTNIALVRTRVDIQIKENYEVRASFHSSMGTPYVFHLNKWAAETKPGTVTTSSPLNKFARLMIERYPTDLFGQLIQQEDCNGISECLQISREQIINMLKYATVQVFECVEEIIKRHQRSLLDYCMYHRKQGYYDTYEQYIHFMACHCLVQSHFLAPGITFEPVEYCSVVRDFDESVLNNFADDEEKNLPVIYFYNYLPYR